jgi:predicted 3-demethylubiquinone-9 3-methyltransferase (glyoxalase superfamily)
MFYDVAMQKIVPHLWFDTQARAAAEAYVDAFPHSKIVSSVLLPATPSGTAESLTISLAGYEVMLLSAGPLFTLNPSCSLMVTLPSADAVDALWDRFSPGSTVLMPLDTWPFNPRYGWLTDRFGTSWQLMVDVTQHQPVVIQPALMFTGAIAGHAEHALMAYTRLFERSSVDLLARYEPGESPADAPGTIKHGRFTLAGQPFAALDSALPHGFAFNEAFSLLVRCDTQAEIDRLWDALSADPEAEQCGWLKDSFGLSWQICPTRMDEMMATGTPEQIARVTAAFMPMKKLDAAALEAAFAG